MPRPTPQLTPSMAPRRVAPRPVRLARVARLVRLLRLPRLPKPVRLARPVRLALLPLLLTLLPPALVPSHASAQLEIADASRPRWQGEVTTIGVNVVLGGLSSALVRRTAGESFWRAFAGGAAGGGVVYAGKKLSGQGTSMSGLLGRQLGAVGSSMVLNAGQGRDLLEQVVLPVGPLWLHVDRGEGGESAFRVRVDLPAALIVAYAVTRNDFSFDFATSLSAGAPVFQYHGGSEWSGRHVGGVILVRRESGPLLTVAAGSGVAAAGGVSAAGGISASGGVSAVAAGGSASAFSTAALVHEQIHVVQRDFAAIAWANPANGWALDRFGWGASLNRRVALGSDYLLWGILNPLIDYHDRPWEKEAHFLMNP